MSEDVLLMENTGAGNLVKLFQFWCILYKK